MKQRSIRTHRVGFVVCMCTLLLVCASWMISLCMISQFNGTQSIKTLNNTSFSHSQWWVFIWAGECRLVYYRSSARKSASEVQTWQSLYGLQSGGTIRIGSAFSDCKGILDYLRACGIRIPIIYAIIRTPSNGRRHEISMPLWLPAVLSMLGTIMFWRQRKKSFAEYACRACGYCLIGNRSGVCSECGLLVGENNGVMENKVVKSAP